MRKILASILSVICAALMIGALVACGDGNDDGLTDYKVSVYSVGGDKLRGVTVSLYDDDLNRVAYDTTDSTGSVNLRAEAGEYEIKLTTLPNGYSQPDEDYFTDKNGEEVKIYLTSKVIEGSAPAGHFYSIGDVMYDFTITTSEGNTFKLSEKLSEELENKRMVLINFWYDGCTYCEMEFPAMEEAFNSEFTTPTTNGTHFSDYVSIIALSYKDKNPDIESYRTRYDHRNADIDWAFDTEGLTYMFPLEGFPTSVVIDRYGVYCFLHSGYYPTTEEFTRLFTKYCSDDYSQNIFRDDDDLTQIERPKPDVDPVESSVIEAAINGENADGTTFSGTYRPETETSDAEYSWPWLVGEEEDGTKYIYNSNQGKQMYSFATIYLDYHAEAGDVLAFQLYMNIERGYDYLYIFYDNGEAVPISGLTENGWMDYYLYVHKEAGDYQVCFFYYADELNADDLVEDIVKIRNIRLTTADEIDTERDIKYHCATGFNEDEQKWESYVEVGLNDDDHYYHILDEEGEPNGPIVMLNALAGSHWSNYSVFTYANDGDCDFGAEGNYNALLLEYCGYATYSDFYGYVPVTEELKTALVAMTKNLGDGTYENEWLEMCVYYERYGSDRPIADPIRTIAPFRAIELHLYSGDAYTDDNYQSGVDDGYLNAIEITKAVMPRGLYYTFTPEVTAVYEIKSYGTYAPICWVFEAENFDYSTSKLLNEDSESGENFTHYVAMQAGKTYYIMLDMYFQDGTVFGTYYVGIRQMEGDITRLYNVTSYAYTTANPDDITNAFVAAKIILFAEHFLVDPDTNNPYILEGKLISDIYVDLIGYNPLTGEDRDGNPVSLARIFQAAIDGKPFEMYEYDKNGNAIPKTDENGDIVYYPVYDEDGNPELDDEGEQIYGIEYKTKQITFDEETLEYLADLIEESKQVGKDSEIYGMVKVDAKLMNFLIEFVHSISDMRAGIAGEGEDAKYVEDEWLMLCYFYRTYSVNNL